MGWQDIRAAMGQAGALPGKIVGSALGGIQQGLNSNEGARDLLSRGPAAMAMGRGQYGAAAAMQAEQYQRQQDKAALDRQQWFQAAFNERFPNQNFNPQNSQDRSDLLTLLGQATGSPDEAYGIFKKMMEGSQLHAQQQAAQATEARAQGTYDQDQALGEQQLQLNEQEIQAGQQGGGELGMAQNQRQHLEAGIAQMAPGDPNRPEAVRRLGDINNQIGNLTGGSQNENNMLRLMAQAMNNYRNHEEKDYRMSEAGYRNLLLAQDGAVGDVALVNAFVKTVDPGSIVRQAESDAIRDSLGITDALLAEFKKQSGEGTLTDKMRQQIRAQGAAYIMALRKAQVTKIESYRQTYKSLFPEDRYQARIDGGWDGMYPLLEKNGYDRASDTWREEDGYPIEYYNPETGEVEAG